MSGISFLMEELAWLQECDKLFKHTEDVGIVEDDEANDDGDDLESDIDKNRAQQCFNHRTLLLTLHYELVR
jgi:hypothetical protein